MWTGAVESARAYGIDISLLRSCLERPPEERLRMACGNATAIAHIRRRSADYAGLLDRLLASQARFVVVGSMAAAAQGSAYIPNDLDICVDTTPENVEVLASVLQPLHSRIRQADADGERHIDEKMILLNPHLALRTDEGNVDLLTCVEGLGDYGECLAVSEPIPWCHGHVRVLAVEGLIIALENRLTPAEVGPLMALEALLGLSREGDERRIPTVQCL